MGPITSKSFLGSLAWFALAAIAHGQDPAAPKSELPAAAVPQKRSVSYATHGMAATSDLRAVQAAVDILKAGGSAVDAAIAANAVLGVVEPMGCGVGGDLFAIHCTADGRMAGLNASGRAPALATIDEFKRRGLEEIPTYGPLSWSVPGCVAGWHDLHDRYGKLPWARLFEPAIRLAEEGFPVAPVIAGSWKEQEEGLRQTPSGASTFLIDGETPREGDIFRNPMVAETYRKIARGGAEVFYRGELAAAIDRYSRSVGGLLRREDFEAHRSEWVDPVSTNYRGYDVWELPPNGQGIAVLQMLNLIEPHDVRAMGWGSPQWCHLFVEAKKIAFADRAKFYADPAMAEVPVRELISKEYAAARGRLFDPDQALVDVPAGDPKLARGDTVYLCVVDADRNCCSLIQSNFLNFGSWHAAGELGFAMQNRGSSFSLDPAHANSLAPGKRPFHTIIPALVTKDGRPIFVFGVMGGDVQPQGHVQILVNWIDFGMNVQQAGDAPRLRHEGGASPTGAAAEPGRGTVFAEPGFPQGTLEALEEKGHAVDSGGFFGGYQGIRIDWERGVLHGGSESRKDGAALGY